MRSYLKELKGLKGGDCPYLNLEKGVEGRRESSRGTIREEEGCQRKRRGKGNRE